MDLLCRLLENADILSFFGVCIFGYLVHSQTKKLHNENLRLQNKTIELEEENLKNNTYTFLSIENIKINALVWWENRNIKTYKLENSIPLVPLDNDSNKMHIGFKKSDHETHWEVINPYEGVLYEEAINPELVMWEKRHVNHPSIKVSEIKTYYTPIQLCFFSKSSRNSHVNEIEISNLEISLAGKSLRCIGLRVKLLNR